MSEKAPAADAEPALDRAAIKALWRKHGGKRHGPLVEHYTIEEQAFYRFADDLLAALQAYGDARAREALERAAEACDGIANEWRDKVVRYRAAGNNGPYLGDQSGASYCATAISALKENPNAG